MQIKKIFKFFNEKQTNDLYDFSKLSNFDQVCLAISLQMQDNKIGYCPPEIKVKSSEELYEINDDGNYALTQAGKNLLSYCKTTDEQNRELRKRTSGYREIYQLIVMDSKVHNFESFEDKFDFYKQKYEQMFKTVSLNNEENKNYCYEEGNNEKHLNEVGKKHLVHYRAEYVYMTFYNESHKKLQLEKE